MQMCGGCIEASPQQAGLQHICSWRGHPTQPMPFYVIDHEKVPDDEKLAWMKQELGSDADLATFVARFLELFGEKLKGAVPQKRACLKLFGTYNEAGWKKEGDLPPTELEAFQQVWDPKAPTRCRECNSSLPADTPFTMPYCSDKCREAGKRLSCWRMVSGARCEGKVELRNGCKVCTVCNIGKDREEIVKRAEAGGGDEPGSQPQARRRRPAPHEQPLGLRRGDRPRSCAGLGQAPPHGALGACTNPSSV